MEQTGACSSEENAPQEIRRKSAKATTLSEELLRREDGKVGGGMEWQGNAPKSHNTGDEKDMRDGLGERAPGEKECQETRQPLGRR